MQLEGFFLMVLLGLCGHLRNEPFVVQKLDNCMSFCRGRNTETKIALYFLSSNKEYFMLESPIHFKDVNIIKVPLKT